ncbi:uncharacterized protein LOC131292950 [Anopheles ziemanni]|uniref:uncharacterized protein LOC131271304 n=1 Tax=Anopheles coustani TaxID=139045 RepID=UPI00265ABE96|nr:uncharacterized protein LOC131271304 [Anopheles coustani]XP_058177023.1 uncharacterized protein LOC131292950 [Anopheles ziemanni]
MASSNSTRSPIGKDIFKDKDVFSYVAEVLSFEQNSVLRRNINKDRYELIKEFYIHRELLEYEHLVMLRIFLSKFNHRKLIVMMDGFDEIAPDYQNIVLKMLETLHSLQGVCKLFVSSRPYDFKREMDTILALNEEVQELLSPEQQEAGKSYILKLKNSTEKSGVINGVVDDVPIFVHRIFVDYFAALWFFHNAATTFEITEPPTST